VATGFLQFLLESVATANLRRRFNPMPITVPNYKRKTDRFQFGTLIDMTSES
jgi:hypothetical protein